MQQAALAPGKITVQHYCSRAMLFWPLRPSQGAELTFVLVVLSPCLYMRTMYTTEPLITGL